MRRADLNGLLQTMLLLVSLFWPASVIPNDFFEENGLNEP